MRKVLLSCAMLMALCPFAKAQQAEKLDRGVVAVKTDAGVYVSWRSLAEDPAGQTYDVRGAVWPKTLRGRLTTSTATE